MAEIITNRAVQLLAQHKAAGTQLVIDKFVLAFHPGQDHQAAIDPGITYPISGDIVHTQAVTKTGLINPNLVTYSLYMDENIGPFTFNTIYSIASGETNAVIQVVTTPDTAKIAADIQTSTRGSAMVRNLVLVYNNVGTITNISIDAASWQHDFSGSVGSDISTLQLDLAALTARVAKFEIAGRLDMFAVDNIPNTHFVLDGSTIIDGVLNYPKLAASGSPFLAVSGNDILLTTQNDFLRPKGTSSRELGDYQGDAIRNIWGQFYQYLFAAVSWIGDDKWARGAFNWFKNEENMHSSLRDHYNPAFSGTEFNASNVVPTAEENRPASHTFILAISHGEII